MTNRPASIGTLIAAYHAAKAGQRIATGLWDQPYYTPDEFIRWFRRCLENKINSHDPRFPKGRKADGDYQVELGRIGRYVGNRIIIDWIAPVLGKRVAGVLSGRLRKNSV
jgi:hypothetical protein